MPGLRNRGPCCIFHASLQALHNSGIHRSMRRTEDRTEVGFSARVPVIHKQALEAILSATSGKTWFIRTALRQFNDECEPSPALQAEVNHAMIAMREQEPPRMLD